MKFERVPVVVQRSGSTWCIVLLGQAEHQRRTGRVTASMATVFGNEQRIPIQLAGAFSQGMKLPSKLMLPFL